MNSATFSIKEKIPAAIKAAITHAVYEIVSDPDFGLELSGKVKGRLNKAKKSRRGGISLQEIKRKYL